MEDGIGSGSIWKVNQEEHRKNSLTDLTLELIDLPTTYF